MLLVYMKNPVFTEERDLLSEWAYKDLSQMEKIIQVPWNLHRRCPDLLIDSLRHLIVSVSATKQELGYIIDHITNIPTWDGANQMTWRGETAQFIVDHIFVRG